MKKTKLILTTLCILLFLTSCAQNKEQKMEEIIQEIYKNVKQYPTKPLYSVQVDKTGCRFVLEIKDNADYKFIQNNGESMNLPLNYLITKSGKQTAIIRIYPKEGADYITKYARVNLTFYYAKDVDSSFKEYQIIAKYNLPEGLEEQKLPYYEAIVEFEANVPFDYSKDLETAKDLTKIDNIEEKVVRKYNKMRDIIINFDKVKYEQENIFPTIRYINTSYLSTIKEIRETQDVIPGMMDTTIEKDREILPIENYRMQFYADGKIVALWHKDKMDGMLRIKGKYKNEEGVYEDGEGADPLYLYLPEGSDELKVW